MRRGVVIGGRPDAVSTAREPALRANAPPQGILREGVVDSARMDAKILDAGRFALRAGDRERLRARVAEAVRRARRHGRGARRDHHHPARRRRPDGDRRRLAARRRGVVLLRAARARRVRARRAGRGDGASTSAGRGASRASARRWRELAAHAACDDPGGPRGSGPVAVGGFAFAAEGGGAPHWAGYEPASLHVPEVALARRGDDVHLTLAALARPDDRRRGARGAARDARGRAARPSAAAARPRPRRACSAWSAPCRPSTTRPPSRAPSSGSAPGALDKVVLAREVAGPRARPARRPGAVLGVLREAFPRAVTSSARRAATAPFVAASPELLVRRDGLRAGHAGAGRLDAPQRRPRGRRPPRRAAPALLQGPRGAGDRHAAHRARAAPAQRLGHRRRGAGRRADGQHPASRDADPRAARAAGQRGRAGRPAAPDARRRRRAAGRGGAADPRARGPRPRLVRGPGRLDGRQRGRRVLRRAALRAAHRPRSRAATRASASCATPIRRPSWPRPRSSSRRCCRCSRAERRALERSGAHGIGAAARDSCGVLATTPDASVRGASMRPEDARRASQLGPSRALLSRDGVERGALACACEGVAGCGATRGAAASMGRCRQHARLAACSMTRRVVCAPSALDAGGRVCDDGRGHHGARQSRRRASSRPAAAASPHERALQARLGSTRGRPVDSVDVGLDDDDGHASTRLPTRRARGRHEDRRAGVAPWRRERWTSCGASTPTLSGISLRAPSVRLRASATSKMR